MPFLNSKRLRDYPRIILITMACVLTFNIVFRDGWLGASGQLIGGDFIIFYSGGYQYKTDIHSLYDIQVQAKVQQMLVEPTQLWGTNIYPYPPYVALVHSMMTFLPLPWAFMIHSLLSILLIVASVFLLNRNLTPFLRMEKRISNNQLTILSLSFFPFFVGFQTGQNHSLTLFIVILVTIFILKEKWWLTGLFTGLLIYKPQFALGFLILLFFWGKWRALFSFCIVALSWSGIVICQHGIQPYLDYIQTIPAIMLLPFLEGGGGYLEVAPYGFLVTLFSLGQLAFISSINQLISILAILSYTLMAILSRQGNTKARQISIMGAILFPLIVSPHTLLHDTIILVVFFILWSHFDQSTKLLVKAIIVYTASFILTPIAYFLDIALLAVIPIWLTFELGFLFKKQWTASLQSSTNS